VFFKENSDPAHCLKRCANSLKF